mgnify:CR=1 FL=1
MRRYTRGGMGLDGWRGGYCIYCHRKVGEAQAALRKWVEEKGDSSVRN